MAIADFVLLCGPFPTFFSLMAHSQLSSSLWPILNFLLLFGPFPTFFSLMAHSQLSSSLQYGPFQTLFSFLFNSKLSSLLWPLIVHFKHSSSFWPIPDFLLCNGAFKNFLLCYGPFQTIAIEAHSKLSSLLWPIQNLCP